ncbi:MAG: hypothetical protein J6B34_05210 [Clostridia bacterium]|nr:hypothetical protein [Clostridia bacterium]
MFGMNKELKRLENQQKANEQLNELSNSLKKIDKMIDEFYAEARECLMNNDQVGYELIASSIFYFTDIQKVLKTVKVQFQTYVKTAQVMDTLEGIRPILKNTAAMMNSMPSFSKNNRDFMKFKKGLLRGQLNMKAMTSMMTNINPATDVTRSKEEFDTLKERLLMGTTTTPLTTLNTTTETVTTPKVGTNDDFFKEING